MSVSVCIKFSVEPVEQKSGCYSDCEADYIGSTALYARSKAAERDYHGGRGDNYADYAVEYERIVLSIRWVTAFRTNASPIPEPVPVLLRALSVR